MSSTQENPALKKTLRKIHVIFKTHLDIGFTDYAANVIDQYFTDFIPRALQLAKSLRESDRPERFIWTTGSWLIYDYLERASSTDRTTMETAIQAGDIAWHALPYTFHSELTDPALFAYGLSLSQRLDQRFGRSTIAAKMTDVPGHTRGIVPLLADAGVQFLHIGVNESSTVPDVPPMFVWRDPSGAEIIVMYHHGYGNFMAAPGTDEAILFAHTEDNRGPQNADDIVKLFAELREKYGTDVVASTMDAYVPVLMSVKDSLPVITGEIGDTWIHGVGTDPKKVAQFRELVRLRGEWLRERSDSTNTPEFDTFSQQLMLVSEHTWGMDIKTHLNDWEGYDKDAFIAKHHQANYQAVEKSWQEQRDYITKAVAALGESQWGKTARQRLQSLEPHRTDLNSYQTADVAAIFDLPHFKIGFDPQTGAISHLIDKSNRREWATPQNPLAQIGYELFGQADYDRYFEQFIQNIAQHGWWSRPDYSKPGMDTADVTHQYAAPALTGLYHCQDKDADYFVITVAFDSALCEQYGSPRDIITRYTFPHDEPVIHIDLQWFGKDASRLPEAIWLSFKPAIQDENGWTMRKMGQDVSPLDVVSKGNRHLHAVETGITYRDENGQFTIETLDAPLVAPGERSLLNFSNKQPPMKEGMHFLLFNNIWGTNFPQWYDEDARFRFVIRC